MRRRSKNMLFGVVKHIFAKRYEWGLRHEREVLVFNFHGVFETTREIESGTVHPQQRLTVEDVRNLIDEFMTGGYTFLRPVDLLSSDKTKRRNVILTFDDGYRSILRVMPVLREYGVPAAAYISTWHMQSGAPFWWDIVYRERFKQGRLHGDIVTEEQWLHTKNQMFIESYCHRMFGTANVENATEEGRPLSSMEVAQLSKSSLVEIGNHTHRHVRLTRCSAEETTREIEVAQDILHDVTGVLPLSIAYPHGDFATNVCSAARKAGLSVGFTTQATAFRLREKQEADLLAIGRITLVRRKDERIFMDESRPDLADYRRMRRYLKRC